MLFLSILTTVLLCFNIFLFGMIVAMDGQKAKSYMKLVIFFIMTQLVALVTVWLYYNLI